MAIYETPWYLIDTEDFETESDVKEMIGHISKEAFALCRSCHNHDACMDDLNTAECYPRCIRREEYQVLEEVMTALIPYGVAMATKNVA